MRSKSALILAFGLLLLFLPHSNAWAGTATLTWNAPTTNADGTPLTDLAGYKVYYGTASFTYTQVVDVGLTSSPATPTYIVTDLADGNTYYFAVTAYSSSGNESGISNEGSKTFAGGTTTSTTTQQTTTTTIQTTTTSSTTTTTTTTTTIQTTTTTSTTTTTAIPPDTTPPVITAIAVTNITDSGAVIAWATNEASTSLVEYGTTAAYGLVTPLGSTHITEHSKTVGGLQASTTYHYRISSADATGNLAISGDNTFTTSETPDTTPSIISGVSASRITSSGAVIGWSTDEGATSQVEYGTTSFYGSSSVLDPALLISHSQSITGLLPSTLYHFRVNSTDGAGNLSVSGDYVFITAGPPDTTPPGDVQNFTAVAGDQKITLSWTGPPDLDFVGVRIIYRTDRFPTGLNDGILLGDFTGLPNEIMTTNHTGLQNGVTYYYAASSYDGHGNFQSTAHASAISSAISSEDFSGSIGGGCGMVFPTDGRPSGPGQAADMTGLLTAMLLLWIRRKIRNLKSQAFHPLIRPAGHCRFSPVGWKKSFDGYMPLAMLR